MKIIWGILILLPSLVFSESDFSKSCSSRNWVRNFSKENGGGHRWSGSKLLKIDKTLFSPLNWADPNMRDCKHTRLPVDADCLVRDIESLQAERIFDRINLLELKGINQFGQDDSIQSIINDELGLKKLAKSSSPYIFSKDLTCCLPMGSLLDKYGHESDCCTGFANEKGRCTLSSNYSNISVYLNRFVSNEAKKLPSSHFNQRTGFIKEKSTVAKLACDLKMCESDLIAEGVAYNFLQVPGHELSSTPYYTKRFIDGNSINQHSGLGFIFDLGLFWNNNLYCVPKGFDQLVNKLGLANFVKMISCLP